MRTKHMCTYNLLNYWYYFFLLLFSVHCTEKVSRKLYRIFVKHMWWGRMVIVIKWISTQQLLYFVSNFIVYHAMNKIFLMDYLWSSYTYHFHKIWSFLVYLKKMFLQRCHKWEIFIMMKVNLVSKDLFPPYSY